MKFCSNMYLDNRSNPREFQGNQLKVKVTLVFWCFSVCMILLLPADNSQPWARLDDLVCICVHLLYVNGFCAEDRLCMGLTETDASRLDNKDASEAPASGSCELSVQSHHHKFVWPGIDAIIEAYASHDEGDDIFILPTSVCVYSLVSCLCVCL